MLKLSIIQGLAEGAAESLTKFFLENSGNEQSQSATAQIIQQYPVNRQVKQEKVKQIIDQLLESGQKEAENLQQRLEQVKSKRKQRS